MLQLRDLCKTYTTGDFTQVALAGVSLDLRDNEFVAILGPSGSGKTTLLNIIGGLDRYESGDLIINGVSTKQYKDRDWDAYRNHTIGFVFQSYNLIAHQSVLANVELALTISGVSKWERRRRAREALEKVGLADHIHKRPNQLSGGQMQRVAIARALVNDPRIVLADEPTGALDSETSVQIMELLKEVARDRLVVMVTHNPELADAYATRIVRLKDGVITDDSDPVAPEEVDSTDNAVHRSLGRASMSFFTSLSLSFKNLWTKKARTLLTAFAGSIGIIGIALILSLSTGVNQYITDLQHDAMNAYPIIINAETVDMSSLMSSAGLMASEAADVTEDDGQVHANNGILEMDANMNASITENDLTAFKTYLDDPDSDIRQYLGTNGIVYTYNVDFDVYTTDTDGAIINTNRDTNTSMDEMEESQSSMENADIAINMNPMLAGSTVGAENFDEIIPGADDTLISPVVTDSYDVVAGRWPEAYDEVVLVLDDKNSIQSSVLYQLGLISDDDYKAIQDALAAGEEAAEPSWSYDTLMGKTFQLVPACDYYKDNGDGTFTDVRDDVSQQQALYDGGIPLKVSGIIRPKDGSENASIQANVAYTRALTDHLITLTDQSAVVTAQEATPETNVLTGVEFTASDDAAKAADATAYMQNLGVSEKASLYTMMMVAMAQESGDGSGDMSAMAAMGSMSGDEESAAAALDAWLASSPDQAVLVDFYDQYLGDVTYEDNLTDFGKVSLDAPYSISIYTDTFEDKEGVTTAIEKYNADRPEDEQIVYTDYVALLTSSLTSMVNVVTYVLIAFVAVSLIVSCIMIGIITHISVLERTKEIGILRAIGASKRNISQVFNAETLIIGLCSGALGVGLSVALTYPINAVLHQLIENTDVTVFLPPAAGGILVLISVFITMLGGMIPARKAAKKDPVIALRTE